MSKIKVNVKLLWSNIDVKGPDDCWLWKLSTNKKGYGRCGAKVNGVWRLVLVHRVIFILTYGALCSTLKVCQW